MTATVTVPVLIAGAGPVGITLAMDLAHLGVDSIVLEARREVPPNPRCNTTNARSMELLRRLGCADAVRSVGLPPDHNTDIVYLTRLTNGRQPGHELTRYHRSTTTEVREGRQHDVAANWPTPEPQHYLSQLYLEPVLRRHAVDHFGVDLREGWRLDSFEQSALEQNTLEQDTLEQDHEGFPVRAVAVDVETGDRTVLQAKYLVGADGSNSAVRHAIGARLAGVPRIGDTVSTFLRSPELSALAAPVPGWMLRFIGNSVLIAIDGVDHWLFHIRVPPGADRETFDPRQAMFEAVGQPFEFDIVNQARWTARAMVASRFRDRRVFLAGDAAHLWIPMGGFGMNAGMVDAVSLSWRLAGVLQGWLDERILDTYELERAPLGAEVATQAAKWGRDLGQFWISDPGAIATLEADEDARADLGRRIREVNLGEFECPGFQLGAFYRDSPIICHDLVTPPPATTLERYHETSWPGVRLPHLWRSDGASLFDQLGPGFTLLRVGVDPPPADNLVRRADERAIPLAVLDVPEAEAVERYEGYGLVLVRPDQHVAWRSRSDPTVGDSEHVLDVVTGATIPPRVADRYVAERIDASNLGAATLDALADPARSAVSADGQMRFVIDAENGAAPGPILQARLLADGSVGAPRPFAAATAHALATDTRGGVWACMSEGGRVVRIDQGGQIVVEVALGERPERCIEADEALLIAGTNSVWRVLLSDATGRR